MVCDAPETVTEGSAVEAWWGIGGLGLRAKRDNGDFTLPELAEPVVKALGRVSVGGCDWSFCLLRDGLMSDLKVYVGDDFAEASSSCARDRDSNDSLA